MTAELLSLWYIGVRGGVGGLKRAFPKLELGHEQTNIAPTLMVRSVIFRFLESVFL